MYRRYGEERGGGRGRCQPLAEPGAGAEPGGLAASQDDGATAEFVKGGLAAGDAQLKADRGEVDGSLDVGEQCDEGIQVAVLLV